MTNEEQEALNALEAERAVEFEVRRRVAEIAGVEPGAVSITWNRLQCTGAVTKRFVVTARITPGEVTHG